MELQYLEHSCRLGKLRGLKKTTAGKSKKSYFSFQGIPYAKPPVGELRFKAPVPYGKWAGVLDATQEGNDCLQKHMLFGNVVGDEDCLYLNVYTTQLDETAPKKAVIVWIHGGGFAAGSGSTELYGPDFLIEEDIVLVTLNYRLGAFGFLSLESEVAPGNMGLKDQVEALRWVRDNVCDFGGDPGNITICGQSAGAASVQYHIISKLSKGLFHKAILQSGSAGSPWALQCQPREKALLLASLLGCPSQDNDTILQFLRSASAIDIVNAQDRDEIKQGKETLQRSRVFLPCVEVAGAYPFLSDLPRKIMDRGSFTSVPVISGLVNKEGLLHISGKRIKCDMINEDKAMLVPLDVGVPADSQEEKDLGSEVLRFYTNTDILSMEVDVLKGYVDYVTDMGFAIAAENTRQQLLKNSTSPVYSYLITHASLRAISRTLIPRAYPEISQHFLDIGVGHGDELVCQFAVNCPQLPDTLVSPEDQQFMGKYIKAWTTFAKTGDPNCKELETTWQADSLSTPHYLELDKNCKMVDGIAFSERMQFWRKVYEKYSYLY